MLYTRTEGLGRIHNLKQVPIVDDGQKLEETLAIPISHIVNSSLNNIQLVLYTHTGIIQVPYNYDLLYKTLKKFNLHKCQYYGISHYNCASFFSGLKMAINYLKQPANKNSEVLIISGDQSNFLPEGRYIPQSSIMGDSSVALLLSNRVDKNKIISVELLLDTRFYNGVYADKLEASLFNSSYFDNLDILVKKILSKSNSKLEDIDWIVPHNVNVTIWKHFSERNNYDLNKILCDLIPDISHTYNTDALINLEYGIRTGKIKKGQLCLLTGVGLGSFFGACVIKI